MQDLVIAVECVGRNGGNKTKCGSPTELVWKTLSTLLFPVEGFVQLARIEKPVNLVHTHVTSSLDILKS
jgi:hypothetical protein